MMADSFSCFSFFLSVVYKKPSQKIKNNISFPIDFFFPHLANINLFPVFLMELILIELYLFISAPGHQHY